MGIYGSRWERLKGREYLEGAINDWYKNQSNYYLSIEHPPAKIDSNNRHDSQKNNTRKMGLICLFVINKVFEFHESIFLHSNNASPRIAREPIKLTIRSHIISLESKELYPIDVPTIRYSTTGTYFEYLFIVYFQLSAENINYNIFCILCIL